MNKTEGKNNRIIQLIISVSLVLISIIIWNLITPFQIDNDNIYLKTVASGEMTGVPEAHMYYMGYLSGFVISLLYRITGNGIPWFGIFMCVSFAVVLVAMIYESLKKTDKIQAKLSVAALYLLVIWSFFYQYFAKTQYTLATGFVGAGALFLLALSDEKEETKNNIFHYVLFLIFSAWSMGIRDKAFFMLIPFFGMTFLGKLIFAKKKEAVKKVFILGFSFLAVLALVFVINKIAYSSDDWKEFRRYTNASEDLFDYEGFPDYSTHEEMYKNMGITHSSYEALMNHYNIIMDSNLNADNLTLLAETSRKERLEKEPNALIKMFGVLKTIVKYNLFEYQDRPLNLLVFSLYFFVVVLILLSKKYKCFIDVLFLIVARMFDWIYLVWNGRFPFRVTQIIYIAELVVLLSVILKNELWKKENPTDNKKEKVSFNVVYAIMFACIVAVSLRFGLPVMKKNYESVKGFEKMSVCFEELEDYFDDHSENFYFFDMSHLYYMEDTLVFEKSPYENYVYMGSWMPNSPWYNNKMKAWGIDDPGESLIEKDNVYIVYQQVDFDTRDFLDYYFEEHFPGTHIEVVDTFVSSNGFVYEILKPVYTK